MERGWIQKQEQVFVVWSTQVGVCVCVWQLNSEGNVL